MRKALAAADAETARLIEQALDLYRKTAANDGFPANDLAYAFEYFVVNNYQVFKYLLDIRADPEVTNIDDPLARLQAIKVRETMKVTLTQARAVYEQFRRVLAENPEVEKMTDRQKQEVAERLALATGLSYFRFSQGSQNKSAEQMEKGRKFAQANLERLFGGAAAADLRIANNGPEF